MSVRNTTSDKDTDSEPETNNGCPIPVISSSTLFNNRKEIIIQHSGEHYRLRITRQGKLILTK